MPGGGDEAAQAAEVAAAAIGEFDRVITRVRGDGAPPEALAFRALAAAEFVRLRGERDPEPWRDAADQFSRLSEVLRAAYGDFRAAEAAALSGGRAAEIALPLRAAFEVASDVGARPFRREVEALARRTGIALESTSSSNAGAASELGLTDRESRPSADRRGADQSPDRRAAVHHHQDGERPRLSHTDQARRHQPRRGGRGGSPAGADERPSRRVTPRGLRSLRRRIGHLPDAWRGRLTVVWRQVISNDLEETMTVTPLTYIAA